MIDTALACRTSVTDLMNMTPGQLEDIRLALRAVLNKQKTAK